MIKFIKSDEVINLINDNDVVAISGFACLGVPEVLLNDLEKRYLDTGKPNDLTLMFAAAQGDGLNKGLNHLAYEGLVKRVIGGHFNLAPKLGKLLLDNKIEGYNFPQGVMCNMFRNIARKASGTISKVGLDTFVDPRIEGGKINPKSTENLVEVININGEENLLYKHFKINVALIKATYSDEYGNISMEHEATYSEALVIAQSCKNCNGIVIVQVDKIINNINCRNIKIPKIYVDYVIEVDCEEDNVQVLNVGYNPLLCGENIDKSNMRSSEDEEIINTSVNQFNAKTIIAKRASMEITKDSIINIGIGTPEEISKVAKKDYNMTLTVEPGAIGGVPQSGARFGSSLNPECILDQPEQFDFYDGGGLDIGFLGMAECDKYGNINVSKFGDKLAGCGGFINITQNAKKVVFCGTFTVKGLKVKIINGKLYIENEGEKKKFIDFVNQITFSGKRARKSDQKVIYITERCVFELKKDGIYLTEVAPGIDIRSEILDLMDFKPKIDSELKIMDKRIFL